MKTRDTQRMNKQIRRREEHRKREIKEQLIKLRDVCGILNPTPFEAVENMVHRQQGVKVG